MPEFLIPAADEEALFDSADPLSFSLHTDPTHKYVCHDQAPNLPDDRTVSPRSAPRAWLIESLRTQIVDVDDQRHFVKAVNKALDEHSVTLEALGDTYSWLDDQREDAKKRQLTKHTRRPTSAP